VPGVQNSLKLKQDQTTPRDAKSRAVNRALEVRRVASRIESAVASRVVARAESERFAGLCADEAEAMAGAGLMRQCGHVNNVWHAQSLVNDIGQEFEGLGTLYACNVRTCGFCMNARRKLSRRRAREGMARVRLGSGEKWFFVTLTVPTMPARVSPLFETLEVVREAWGLFTKHGRWNALARASIKGCEFTLGEQRCQEHRNANKHRNSKACAECPDCRRWDAERDGYHAHLHLLAVARWIKADELRAAWSDCLRKVWKRRGLDRAINTRDGLAVCHVALVTDRKVERRGGVINREGAISEVAKYITKADSFLSIPEDQLIDVASVRRWPRMFELLGECRAPRKHAAPEHDASASGSDYLDTQNLSSALNARNEQLKKVLRVFRAHGVPIRLCGDKLLLAKGCELGNEELAAYEAEVRSYGRMRARGIPLRSRAVALLLRGEWELWNEELAAHVAEVRSYRRTMLSRTFTRATFRTLADECWYGTESNPACAFEAGALNAHRADHRDYLDEHRDEIAEGVAIEDEARLSDARRKDRAEWQQFVNENEDRQRIEFRDERVFRTWLVDGKPHDEFDATATHEQRAARKTLHDRYEDTEMLRALLFSQGRAAEWFAWISTPGAQMPDARKG
jgi:hypothetical protein